MGTPVTTVVTLFESMSVNGIIARPDGDASYFGDNSWQAFVDLAREAGATVWGRRTHRPFSEQAIADLRGVHKLVLTSNRELEVGSGWELAASPEEAVKLAAEAGAKELIVAGGAMVNTAFARAGLIDRMVIDVGSIVMGEGLPLFTPAKFDLNLHLRDVKYPLPTVVQLHYDVLRG